MTVLDSPYKSAYLTFLGCTASVPGLVCARSFVSMYSAALGAISDQRCLVPVLMVFMASQKLHLYTLVPTCPVQRSHFADASSQLHL